MVYSLLPHINLRSSHPPWFTHVLILTYSIILTFSYWSSFPQLLLVYWPICRRFVDVLSSVHFFIHLSLLTHLDHLLYHDLFTYSSLFPDSLAFIYAPTYLSLLKYLDLLTELHTDSFYLLNTNSTWLRQTSRVAQYSWLSLWFILVTHHMLNLSYSHTLDCSLFFFLLTDSTCTHLMLTRIHIHIDSAKCTHPLWFAYSIIFIFYLLVFLSCDNFVLMITQLKSFALFKYSFQSNCFVFCKMYILTRKYLWIIGRCFADVHFFLSNSLTILTVFQWRFLFLFQWRIFLYLVYYLEFKR